MALLSPARCLARLLASPLGLPFAAVRGRVAQGVVVASALPCSAGDRPRLLAGLAARAPWCLMGYTAERADRWVRERAAVLAEVDRRRDIGGAAE